MAGSYGATPPPPKRGPGRPSDNPLTAMIKARVSPQQKAKFEALGGSEWLRKQIDAATINERKVTEK